MRKSHQELQAGLTLDGQIAKLRARFDQFQDHRAANSSYHLSDILMSGFAMFSLKYPSLLQFETQTQVEQQNLQQLYGVKKLCTDSQLRKVLDKLDGTRLKSFHGEHFKELDRLGILKAYRTYGDFLVVAVDGVTHFESNKVHCPACIEKPHQDGSVSYSHSMLVCHAGQSREKKRSLCWAMKPSFVRTEPSRMIVNVTLPNACWTGSARNTRPQVAAYRGCPLRKRSSHPTNHQ
jgi:hypothetical protein